jgi:hypothetical protein
LLPQAVLYQRAVCFLLAAVVTVSLRLAWFLLQAAAFMKQQIDDAYDKWTTGFYDYIQSLQNKIP